MPVQMEFFTYILQSQTTGRFYIGQMDDLERRLEQHRAGYSKYTAKSGPWNLLWYQRFPSRKDAFAIEPHLKKLKSRARLIRHMAENRCAHGSENLQICDLLDFRESSQL